MEHAVETQYIIVPTTNTFGHKIIVHGELRGSISNWNTC
jgi:hypothetical protein